VLVPVASVVVEVGCAVVPVVLVGAAVVSPELLVVSSAPVLVLVLVAPPVDPVVLPSPPPHATIHSNDEPTRRRMSPACPSRTRTGATTIAAVSRPPPPRMLDRTCSSGHLRIAHTPRATRPSKPWFHASGSVVNLTGSGTFGPPGRDTPPA